VNPVLKKLAWKLIPNVLARRHLRKGDKWEEIEMYIAPLFLSKDSESIDVGANSGMYSIVMSIFSGHVYAFEPSQQLASDLRTLSLPNMSVSSNALGSSVGSAHYYVPVDGEARIYSVASLHEPALSDHGNL